MTSTVLVTGGLGYIGSHTCVELMQAGYEPVIVDNLSNSKRSVLGRIEELGGRAVAFEKLDLRDRAALGRLFAQHRFAAVLHFAGLKAVGESVEKPLAYYDNNVGGTIALLEAVLEQRVPHFVFSSSATVYGTPQRLPLTREGVAKAEADCATARRELRARHRHPCRVCGERAGAVRAEPIARP